MDLNEMLGFIIAVIGVVLLGFFGVKLYNFFVDAEMKNAQSFIDDLNGKIETLNNGENNTFGMRGIPGWVLVGWNKDVPIALEGEVISKDRKPQKCFDEDNCLCICESSISKCQEAGYCRAVDKEINVNSSSTISLDLVYIETPNPNYYVNMSASCYSAFKPLDELFIEKNSDGIKIIVNYGIIKDGAEYNKLVSILSLCPDYRSAYEESESGRSFIINS